MEQLLSRKKSDFSNPLSVYNVADRLNNANNDESQTDGFYIDLKSLNLKSGDDQIDRLILAWLLLLQRGSLQQSGDNLTWGAAVFQPEKEAPTKTLSAKVNDVIGSDVDTISENLDTIRTLHTLRDRRVDRDEYEITLAALHEIDVC